jgi:hypothetical protein
MMIMIMIIIIIIIIIQKLNTVPHSHQSPEISSERHEANKNHNSQETEGKMGSKKTAWTVSTEPR